MTLKGFQNIYSYGLTNNIQDSLIEYFDWGLLEKGNYFNVEKGEESHNGNDMSRLRRSNDDTFNDGQVWEGFRGNWVWQSGINPSGFNPPIVGVDENWPGISGVYIDGNFEPASGVGQYKHKVDYFNGRVVFDSAISPNSTVQAEFSYKYINVLYANNVPWLKEVQARTKQPNSRFYDTSDGSWDIPPDSRVQLPAIAIEVVPSRTFKGYQLGGGQWVYTDVLFHCIAEDESTRNQLIDIISMQNDKTINVLDCDKLHADSNYPINHAGSPVPSALRYPDLIDQYNGGLLRLTQGRVDDMTMLTPGIFGGVVRFTAEGVKTNI